MGCHVTVSVTGDPDMHLVFLFFSVLAAAVFFAGSLVLTSMGYRYGKRYLRENGGTSLAGFGNIEAAIFALAGLLIAFSFSGALERFDERRKLMTAEGNAISTAYDQLDMMENDRKLAIKAKVKEYFAARIALYHEGIGYSLWEGVEVEIPSYTARIDKLRTEIWNDAIAACEATDLKLICAMTLHRSAKCLRQRGREMAQTGGTLHTPSTSRCSLLGLGALS